MYKYSTVQGDMWDVISLRAYNTELLMHVLIEANPQYRNTVVFPANCELDIPDITTEAIPTAPVWRRNT